MFDIKSSIKSLLSLHVPQNMQDWVQLLDVEFGEKRNGLSSDFTELTKALRLAVKFGVIGVSIPSAEGGLNLNYKQQHNYYKFLSQISGTFAFFSTQFTTALSIISSGSNTELKQKLLKKNGLANSFIGISTAHLKNFKSPMVNGQKKQTQYVVNGTLRYVSGYRIFNLLVLGFVCDNEEVFALIPFYDSKSFSVQPQVNFVAANSTNTVNVILDNYIINDEMIISKAQLGTVCGAISKSTRHLVSFQIGLAYGIMNLIQNSSYMKIHRVIDTYNYLTKNLLAIDHKMAGLPENTSVIQIRIEVVALLNQIFLFADQIFKGAATISNHPYALIKHESQVIGATASSEDTLIETCKYIISTNNYI